jgi:copper chaperone CopZ
MMSTQLIRIAPSPLGLAMLLRYCRNPLQIICCAMCILFVEPPPVAAEEVQVKYRLTGLFQPDRVADLRLQAAELPANRKIQPVEVKLVDVDYDSAIVTFSYDDTKVFKNQKPEQILKRIDELLRQASKGAFSVSPLSTLPPDRWKMERIAVKGHDCKGCNYGLYRCISNIEGVERAVANFKDGHITAWIDPSKTSREVLVDALRKKQVELVDLVDKPKTK